MQLPKGLFSPLSSCIWDSKRTKINLYRAGIAHVTSMLLGCVGKMGLGIKYWSKPVLDAWLCRFL